MKFAEVAYKFPGFRGQARSIREYPFNAGGNLLGYVSEVNARYIENNPDEYKSGEEDPESPDYVAPPNFASPKWKIPEEYRINEEGLESIQDSVLSGTGMQEEVVEVFRFFSDGGASGALKFVLQSDKLAKTFRISPLTGRILVEETEVSEW